MTNPIINIAITTFLATIITTPISVAITNFFKKKEKRIENVYSPLISILNKVNNRKINPPFHREIVKLIERRYEDIPESMRDPVRMNREIRTLVQKTFCFSKEEHTQICKIFERYRSLDEPLAREWDMFKDGPYLEKEIEGRIYLYFDFVRNFPAMVEEGYELATQKATKEVVNEASKLLFFTFSSILIPLFITYLLVSAEMRIYFMQNFKWLFWIILMCSVFAIQFLTTKLNFSFPEPSEKFDLGYIWKKNRKKLIFLNVIFLFTFILVFSLLFLPKATFVSSRVTHTEFKEEWAEGAIKIRVSDTLEEKYTLSFDLLQYITLKPVEIVGIVDCSVDQLQDIYGNATNKENYCFFQTNNSFSKLNVTISGENQSQIINISKVFGKPYLINREYYEIIMTNPYNRTIYSDKTYWDIRPRGHYQGCHISKINVNREQITPKPIEHRDFSDCYEVDAEDCDFEVGLKSNLMHFWYVQLQPLAECTVRINLLCDT